MGQLVQVTIKVLVLAGFFSQVLGNPMMFYTENDPDCSQQQSEYNSPEQNYQAAYQGYQGAAYQAQGYPAPTYQGAGYQSANYQVPQYQGPSYQDTLQAMISETLRTLCNIVQNTVIASKQEIAALAKIFMQKASGSNCDSESEEADIPSHSLGNPSYSIDVRKHPIGSTTLSNLPLQNRFAEVTNSSTTPTQAAESTSMKNNSSGNVEEQNSSGGMNSTTLPSSSPVEMTTLSLKMGTSNNDTSKTTSDKLDMKLQS